MKAETDLGRQLRKKMTIEGTDNELRNYDIELSINGRQLTTRIVSGCFKGSDVVEGGIKHIGFKRIGKLRESGRYDFQEGKKDL